MGYPPLGARPPGAERDPLPGESGNPAGSCRCQLAKYLSPPSHPRAFASPHRLGRQDLPGDHQEVTRESLSPIFRTFSEGPWRLLLGVPECNWY